MALERLLAKCEEDTRRLINPRAAAALGRWRHCQTEDERVDFVRRLIRDSRGQANGYEIDRLSGISLESIVLDHASELFNDDDKAIAAITLGRPIARKEKFAASYSPQ